MLNIVSYIRPVLYLFCDAAKDGFLGSGNKLGMYFYFGVGILENNLRHDALIVSCVGEQSYMIS